MNDPAIRIKRKRLWSVFLNGARTMITPAITLLIALLVIRLHSKSLWGEFVPYLLYFHIANIITNWGGKDYLLRDFSQNPGNIQNAWQTIFVARVPLLIISQLSVFAFFPFLESIYLLLCIGFTYISTSYLPVVNYLRQYSRVILVEFLSFITLGIILYMQREELELKVLLQTYLIYQIVRVTIYSIYYRSFLKNIKWHIQLKYLKYASPFFLLAITGFLQSKFDLYIFKGFSLKTELADYQIISGFLMFLQGIATILLMPYVRNIYRMKQKSLVRIASYIGWIGIPLTGIAIFILYFILLNVFEIKLNTYQLGCIFLTSYPSFLYVVNVFYGFGKNKEKQVLIVSVISALSNGLLSIVFLSLDLNITGVLLAHGIAQLIALVGFRFLLRNDYTPQENQ